VGAFMVMKRELYIEIGGFDENCFMYSDDIDLSYMALKTGRSNYYFHQTTVIHYKGESTVRDGTYMKRFQEAMNFFYKKHFKGSIFFSVFMKTGIVFFSILKRLQGKIKDKLKPESYFLVSESLHKKELMLKLEMNLNAKITNDKPDSTRTEFIIDLNSCSFKQAIQLLETNKKDNFTFKLLPPNSNFIIGSDSSNDRGEVILLNELKK
jgi:hypothetical protein